MLAEIDIENFDRIMNINARGNLLCVRAEAAAMRKQTPKTWEGRNGTRDIGRGAIVNMASANSFAGLPGKGGYTISKHAMAGITKMAGMSSFISPYSFPARTNAMPGLDHSPEGVRVNCICPTWVRTPLLDVDISKNPDILDQIQALCPIKRAAECEEVADAIAFLCSPSASYINGTSLTIDAAITTTLRMYT